jgi:FAD/FMN-containing dehydrogenase
VTSHQSSNQSWGRYPPASQTIRSLYWTGERFPAESPNGTILCQGLARSYGDACLNDGGTLLITTGLDRFIAFDEASGILRCEAGVSLAEVLRVFVPRGWFLPVLPGTGFVTIGGAIANDIHGKNHHVAGSFGNFVRSFLLRRSDGPPLLCSPDSNPELFRATIGGIGLTGMIEWAEIALRPITNAWIDVETIRYNNLEEFFSLSAQSEPLYLYEYLVAWVDTSATGKSLGRGILMRGNHNADPALRAQVPPSGSALNMPFDLPSFVLNPLTIRALNFAYYTKQLRRFQSSVVPYRPFFSPLDGIGNWNRMYGKRGFLQWQCLVPTSGGRQAFAEIFAAVVRSGLASFVSVMKTMGAIPSRGLMSFPGPGVTLALDFPNVPDSFRLLERLDDLVQEAGGRIYLAKDARMSASHFQRSYPQWRELEQQRDPMFSSSLWRRLTGAAA